MRHLGFVLFPNVTQLDFTGPMQILARLPGTTAHVVGPSLDPIPTDCGFGLVPTTSFDDCPPLDLLCVPGGYGVDGALHDGVTVPFLKRQGARARYVTSVCTGAFLLGAAGLLEGRRATTHWAYHGLLDRVGAVPTEGRVVVDRGEADPPSEGAARATVITGGGVTAGIDFALSLAAEVCGEEVAQAIQLAVEYDPQPPFGAGHPSRAPEGVRAQVGRRFAERRPAFERALLAALRDGERG